jgi:DNA invertase Pin-like site-specific DNA recombinase
MTKITAEHLSGSAFVYIRQSTADQLKHNQESRRRQYGLAERARQLGWSSVEVIDDDLGRSGGGINRPGFERLLAAICEGRVGAVLAIEASRLARNGRDWHTLIEFCGLVGTVIVDEDGIYDPRHPNDRLLLGMKGTMSELELSLFRQRSQEALKQKARRGALFLRVAAGYVKAGRERIEKDPDQRIQDALKLVFSKFAEFQSVRQVHVWLRDEGISLPAKSQKNGAGARNRLEASALQQRAQHPDQPCLCRRVRLWAHDEQSQRRGRPQTRATRIAALSDGVGCFAQGSARGLYHLERVRAQPEDDCR